MERKKSSYKKALIVMAVAFIVIGVLWAISSASAGGTLFAKVKIDNERDFVNVEYSDTIIGNIRAKQVNVKMFADQIATVEFKTKADVLDAVVMDDNGDVIETYQFTRGKGDIDFFSGGIRVVVLFDPGNNRVYGNFATRTEFLQRCESFSIISMENTINDIFRETGNQDFVAVVKVWVDITQREITNVQGVWNYDEDDGELTLGIKADSNLPRRTKIVYTTFGVTDDTRKVNSDGEINFDIDFDKINVKGDNKIVMKVGEWSDEFKIDRPPEAAGIYVEPEPTPTPIPKSALKSVSKSTSGLAEAPAPTPAPKITRVLADPPKPTPTSETPMSGLCAIAALFAAIKIIKMRD